MSEPAAKVLVDALTFIAQVGGPPLDATAEQAEILTRAADASIGKPIDMVLYCPKCSMQHIDEVEEHDELTRYTVPPSPWSNPPHRSHLCHGCGHIWRPADVPTNGVASVKTKGRNDTP